ncbi:MULTISPECIES: hypothetical protein [unclassified Dysgonomonas]|jgi:hypothetical protein|uniref:hypothetical protein n=1 Tax=unclassified Dysgonomonas TaxID=2630389 RepID=UPI0025B9CC59|nr:MULTISPECIES: hypothetical protein [unclassified Dysgonomonas]MDR2004021.1 hypothetical protein [Prevotella sp.]HMM02563.1 hypothetical protein [Dysgonomonas sp.]
MKNLDLATLGVEEMSDAQMNNTNGGSWALINCNWMISDGVYATFRYRDADGPFAFEHDLYYVV